MNLTRKRLVSTTFALAVIALLYFSGPTTAISVALAEIAGSFYPGQVVTMSATVTLNDYEFIMTTGAATLTLTDPAGGNITCALPINGTVTNQKVTCSNGKNITVTSASGNYDYAYGYGYLYGYKYGYSTSLYNYQYGSDYGSYGYGYAYNDTWTATSLAYTIKWTIPYNYTNGTATAKIDVFAGSTLLDTTSTPITILSLADLPKTTVGVRISELIPNPTGLDDNSTIPGGEWVELENTKNTAIDVSGWKLEDADGHSLTISATNSRDYSSGTAVNSTVIPANSFLVVFRKGGAITLNNNEDTVTLKNASGTVIDVVPYDADDFAALFASILAAEATFPEGFSLVLTAANESACTGAGGLFIGGSCYTVSDSPSPGVANPGGSAAFTKTLIGGNTYNLISIPLTPDNASVAAVLGALTGNYSIVWQYDASETNTSLRWTRYRPNNATVNTLTTWNTGLGAWVRINDSANETLSVTGTAPATTNQTLIGGGTYNLISYVSGTNKNVSTVLSSIAGNYAIIWEYDASETNTSLRWTRYRPNNATVNTLTTMRRGFGYWVRINATANQTLITTY